MLLEDIGGRRHGGTTIRRTPGVLRIYRGTTAQWPEAEVFRLHVLLLGNLATETDAPHPALDDGGVPVI